MILRQAEETRVPDGRGNGDNIARGLAPSGIFTCPVQPIQILLQNYYKEHF
jgi:hypothetical protein